jgi:uncharacterized protein DUF4245
VTGPVSPPARRRGRRAGSVILAAIACLGLTAVFVVATPRPVTPVALVVGYHQDLVAFERAAPYPVFAPEGLPAGWQPVNSRVSVVSGGVVSWHLGFVTPSGQLVALEESDERPVSFIRRMTNSGNVVPPLWSQGEWWARRWRPDKKQRSMYLSRPHALTVVVTGLAGWPEITALAAALRPQP